MEVIALSGGCKTGKDYIANILLKKLPKKNTLIIAFADHFKVDAINKDDLIYEKVFGEKDELTRKKLQLIGTENGRDKYGQNIWINILNTWMSVYNERGIERFIITDLRFKNELEFIQQLNGKIIKIIAPLRQKNNLKNQNNEILNHRSEIELKDFNFNFQINNDYNENLENDILKLITLI